jgi:hypothetical protein
VRGHQIRIIQYWPPILSLITRHFLKRSNLINEAGLSLDDSQGLSAVALAVHSCWSAQDIARWVGSTQRLISALFLYMHTCIYIYTVSQTPQSTSLSPQLTFLLLKGNISQFAA